jgi:hypothetical protein
LTDRVEHVATKSFCEWTPRSYHVREKIMLQGDARSL